MFPTLALIRVPGADGHPSSCRWCRESQNRHGTGRTARFDDTSYDWNLEHGMCIAQDLTKNHVNYFTARLGYPILPRASEVGSPASKRDRSREIGELSRSIDRAAQIWVHRHDNGWLDDARHVLSLVDPQAPDHHRVQVADDDTALFEVVG